MARFQVISVRDALTRAAPFVTAVTTAFPSLTQPLRDEDGNLIWERHVEAPLLWDLEGPGAPRIVTKTRVPDEVLVRMMNMMAAEGAARDVLIADLLARVTALEA